MDTKKWIRRLFVEKKNNLGLLQQFRDDASFSDIRQAGGALKDSGHPFHALFYGRLFPPTYAHLKWEPLPFRTSSLEREIQWLSVGIHCFSDRLSRFLQLKANFEAALLLGNTKCCRSVLDEAQRDLGVSLWVLHSRIVLEELEGGLEASARFVSSLIDSVDVSRLTKLFAHFFKLRVERGVSYDNFRLKLERYLEDYSEDPVIQSYLRFRLGFDDHPQSVVDFRHILAIDRNLPLVDRYLSFVRICHVLCSGTQPPTWLSGICAYAHQMIVDPSLQNLAFALNPSFHLEAMELDKKMLSIIDSYSCGDYAACAKSTADILRSEPLVFELYELHAKSLIYGNKELDIQSNAPVLADQVLRAITCVLRKANRYQDELEFIRKASALLDYSALSGGLRQLYKQEVGILEFSARRFVRTDFMFVNPRTCFLHAATGRASEALGALHKCYPGSATVAFTAELVAGYGGTAKPSFPKEISRKRSLFYQGRILGAQGKYEDALPLFEELYQNHSTSSEISYPLIDQLLPYLFDCYLSLGQILGAADLLVEHHFKNPLQIRRLNVHRLVNEIRCRNDDSIYRDINTPIVYHLHFSAPRKVYVAYDNFLSLNGCSTPRALIARRPHFSAAKWDFFLRNVCSLEVMGESYHFEGTEQLQRERVAICRELISLDGDNRASLQEEIGELSRNIMIRQTIRRIDESRVFVDEKGIRAAGGKIIRENLYRYLQYSTLDMSKIKMMNLRNLSILTTDEAGKVRREKIEEVDLTQVDKVVSLAHYEVFKEVFLDLRDRFISGTTHGLDSYLSVRIRHGTLQGQIRNTFEKLSLVSQFDVTRREYVPNELWGAKAGHLEPSATTKMQALLARFSADIDALTEELKGTVLQIKTEGKNPAGLFDYSFGEDALWEAFTNRFHALREPGEILDQIFAVLWQRTEENLRTIRAHIGTALKNRVYERLVHLQEDLKGVMSDKDVPDLFANVVTCMTSIQHDFDKLASWFHIFRPGHLSHFSPFDLVQVCVKGLNDIHSRSPIAPHIETDDSISFRGSLLSHFSDIVCSLLENVIRHSGVAPSEFGVKIVFRQSGDMLSIAVENRISSETRSRDPVVYLVTRKTGIISGESATSVSQEGGSGYSKLWKIIQVDLGRKRADFHVSYVAKDVFRVELMMELEGLTA